MKQKAEQGMDPLKPETRQDNNKQTSYIEFIRSVASNSNFHQLLKNVSLNPALAGCRKGFWQAITDEVRL